MEKVEEKVEFEQALTEILTSLSNVEQTVGNSCLKNQNKDCEVCYPKHIVNP